MTGKCNPFWGTTSHCTTAHLFVWDEVREQMVPACALHKMSRPVPKSVFPLSDVTADHPGACPACARRSIVYLGKINDGVKAKVS